MLSKLHTRHQTIVVGAVDALGDAVIFCADRPITSAVYVNKEEAEALIAILKERFKGE